MRKRAYGTMRVLDLGRCCELAYNDADDQSDFIGSIYAYGPRVDLTTTPLL